MAKSSTTTTRQAAVAQAQQQAAMAGGGAWQTSITYPGSPNYGGGYVVGGSSNIGGWTPSIGSPNFNFNSITVKEPQTPLQLFEDLVGLIKQLEERLSLDPKDKSKHAFLELIMGRIQEEVINDTIQRLKALKL